MFTTVAGRTDIVTTYFFFSLLNCLVSLNVFPAGLIICLSIRLTATSVLFFIYNESRVGRSERTVENSRLQGKLLPFSFPVYRRG